MVTPVSGRTVPGDDTNAKECTQLMRTGYSTRGDTQGAGYWAVFLEKYEA